LVEEPAQDVVLTPDLKIVYGLPNTLGAANVILAWDTDTGQRRPADDLNQGAVPYDQYIITGGGHTQPIIRNNELFAISPIYTSAGQNNNSWQVKRLSFATDSLIETINPPTAQVLADIALSTSGTTLYAAGTSGIYKYLRASGNFHTIPPELLIPGVDGNLALGLGLLYVRNFANGDVERYDSALGDYIDTIISHTAYPNLGTIQFGIDGNLHVYQGGASPKILKFNSITGGFLSSTPNSQLENSRIFYVVPEPSAAMLLSLGIAASVGRDARKRFAAVDN
jgi:hypothetical protein